jgi:hypothetical protein
MMHCQEMMLASVRSASLVALDCGVSNFKTDHHFNL